MTDDDRTEGVEFDDLMDDLQSLSYPVTTEELQESYGDRTITLAEGETRLGDLLGRLGDDEYQSAREIREAAMSAVGADGVGTEGYSDRGATTETNEEDAS